MEHPSFTIIDTKEAFQQALGAAFVSLNVMPGREIILCDQDFDDWPLSEPAVLEALTAWSAQQRSLTLMACHFDGFTRRHARWVRWRQTWSHRVRCVAVDDADRAQLLTHFLIPGHYVVRLVERACWRGSVSTLKTDIAQAEEMIVAMLQRSQETFPVTTLGL